ncbi:MAG: hypothetical protein R2764_20675 [Bacteroidales bacterium]
MSNRFNHIENWAASFLSRLPGLKRFAKQHYQRANYYLYRKNYNFKTDWEIQKIGSDNPETFFGYYDKFPEQNDWVLFHSFNNGTKKKPSGQFPIGISAYHVSSGETRDFGKSHAYNWQQGSRLQWVDEKSFIFNDVSVDKQHYISKVYSIEKDKLLAQTDFPIYDCHSDFALSLSFKRLAALNSDYGYTFLPFDNTELNDLDNDGIIYVDLKNNSKHLIISFSEVIDQFGQPTMKHAKHKFNHIMISPDGKQFMFIHRWYQKGIKYDSLMVANCDGTNLRCLADDGMVSHCFWKNNAGIFGYLRSQENGNSFYLIDLNTGAKQAVGVGKIDGFGDGHPYISGNKILFDTYPNKSRMQELYLYDLETDELDKIGEFFEPLGYHESFRCDLHPRLSADKNTIYIDSVHEGRRHLYRLTNK